MKAESVFVRAPSNIAIIKYMGKKGAFAGKNWPENPSLSLTLQSLCTELSIHESASGETVLVREKPKGASPVAKVPEIGEAGTRKFLTHLERLAETLPIFGKNFGTPFFALREIEIRSANTFPHSAGIASSASSFAALTLAVGAYLSRDRAVFRERIAGDLEFRSAFSALAREGSGSACRSFFGPWVAWTNDRAAPVESRLPPLTDLVLIVATDPKSVGSSEAHARVKTSPYWSERPARAAERFALAVDALRVGDAETIADLSQVDSEDMHLLFETAVPPFTYRNALSNTIRQQIEAWITELDAHAFCPLVTMDAGPNIHFVIPTTEAAAWKSRFAERFPSLKILSDRQGEGARVIG